MTEAEFNQLKFGDLVSTHDFVSTRDFVGIVITKDARTFFLESASQTTRDRATRTRLFYFSSVQNTLFMTRIA